MQDSTTDPIVRLATPHDVPAMLQVLTRAFDRWPSFPLRTTAQEHLAWKLASTPLHAVLVIDEELVGVSASWHSNLRVGAATLPVYNGADFAILPHLQGKGLGRLLDYIWETDDSSNYLTIDAVSRSAAVQHMYPVTGPTVAAQVWSRPIGLRSAVTSRLRRVGERARPSRSRPLPAPTATRAASLEVEPITSFGDDADQLWHRASAAFDVVWDRGAEWLNWRYLDPRAGMIAVWGVRTADGLLGYVAMRDPDSERVARVLDLFVEPGRQDVSEALLRHATRAAADGGATTIEVWLAPGHPDTVALQRAGFYDSGSDQIVHFDVRKLERTPEAAAILREPATRFHIALGDFDWA